MNIRSVFIYGRPGPHPLHRALVDTITPDFVPVDFLIRWYDVPTGKFRRYLSWLVCALLFPNRRKYHVLVSDGIQFLPAIMRRLRLLRRDQKVVALVASETLFFLRAGRYSRMTTRALIWAMNTYDAIICIGRMETDLARSFVKRDGPMVLTARSGVTRDRLPMLLGNRPALAGHTILFVGNGPSEWRGWYKGLDLLVESIELLAPDLPELRAFVVGDWDPDYLRILNASFPRGYRLVDFVGRADDLSSYLVKAALYVHLGRGEAFGISVLEAMCAGLPALVSEWTGAREAAEQVDARLVVPLDAARAAERIHWYFHLSSGERQKLSARSRDVASEYTEEKAREVFVSEFRRMLRHFDLPDLSPRLSSQ